MRQSYLILSNATIMWATRIFLLAPQLILVPYLLRTIGESGYGIYALAWSLLASIDGLEASLQSGVVKYSAGFLAQGRMGEVNRIVSSSFVYSILLAIVACAGALFAAALYVDPSGQIRSALIVVGIVALFIVPLTPYIGIIQSRQRYYVGAIADTISKYISLFAVMVWFRWVGPSTEALLVIMAALLFLARIAQVPIAYRLVPGLQNRVRLYSNTHFQLIAAFGAATVLASLSLVANSTGVRWLMEALASTSFVAHLAIMLMPASLLAQVIGAMTITVMPATSAYEATGNQRMLKELLIRGMRYSTILALVCLLFAGFMMRNALRVWLGFEYEFLAPYALVLLAGEAFLLSTSVAHHMLKGLGKLRTVVFVYFIGFAVLPFGLILAVFQIWQNPYIASVVGLASGNLVCGGLQLGFCTRAVHADLWMVFKRAYAQPLIVATTISVVSLTFANALNITELVGRACVSALAVSLFLGGCYAFIATAEERQQAGEVMHAALRRIISIWG